MRETERERERRGGTAGMAAVLMIPLLPLLLPSSGTSLTPLAEILQKHTVQSGDIGSSVRHSKYKQVYRYSAFGTCPDPLNFPTFCYVTALF